MSLTPEQVERLTEILQGIEPHIKSMTGASPGFVQDQLKRFEEWGANMRLSPKQWEWLENLYTKHCEDADTAGPRESEDPSGGLGGVDDDIPF